MARIRLGVTGLPTVRRLFVTPHLHERIDEKRQRGLCGVGSVHRAREHEELDALDEAHGSHGRRAGCEWRRDAGPLRSAFNFARNFASRRGEDCRSGSGHGFESGPTTRRPVPLTRVPPLRLRHLGAATRCRDRVCRRNSGSRRRVVCSRLSSRVRRLRIMRRRVARGHPDRKFEMHYLPCGAQAPIPKRAQASMSP